MWHHVLCVETVMIELAEVTERYIIQSHYYSQKFTQTLIWKLHSLRNWDKCSETDQEFVLKSKIKKKLKMLHRENETYVLKP